jgi:hypothetical protein
MNSEKSAGNGQKTKNIQIVLLNQQIGFIQRNSLEILKTKCSIPYRCNIGLC